MFDLKTALRELKNVAADFSSLEVQTYVGDLTMVVNEQGKLKDLEALVAHGAKEGEIRLVAVTRMNIDGDAVCLTGEEPLAEHVQRVHDAALAAGIKSREAIVALFADMTGMVVKK